MMVLTKFAQSCFRITVGRNSILIDPGVYDYNSGNWSSIANAKLDAVFVTHQHPDHCDLNILSALDEKRLPIFANQTTKKWLLQSGIKANLIDPGGDIKIGAIKIMAFKLPHFKLLFCPGCKDVISANITVDKKCSLHPHLLPLHVDGPENIGLWVNDIFFHPGDSLESPAVTVQNVAVPIAGPTVSYEAAWSLVVAVGAKIVIPMHYSNPKYQVDPKLFAQANQLAVKVQILDWGEEITI